ncbi:MAG TPA: hypothetical protein VMT03_08215 [Polyangia bacterium]|nr:hypothetical protein [Polyangia bacterium]
MPRTIRRRPLHWSAIAGAAGALLAATCVLSGCPGDLDPSIKMPSGGTGTGGSTGGGTGGTAADCSGSNAGDQLLTGFCAKSGCHDTSSAPLLGAGLDLTPNSGLASRLVGVKSAGKGASMCGSYPDPYIIANSNPVAGLAVSKIQTNWSTAPNTCGVEMPEIAPLLDATGIQCLTNYFSMLANQ